MKNNSVGVGQVPDLTLKQKAFGITIGIIILLINGCSNLSVKTQTSSATIPLAKPIGPARRIVQQVNARWPQGSASLLAILELDQNHIAMAGVSSEGLNLFSLNYDGVKLTMEKSPLLPEAIAPEYIIADIQFAYWPVSMLQSLLPEGWRLVTSNQGRILYHGEAKQHEATYLSGDSTWPESVVLENFQYSYQLQIKTLSYENLSE